MKTSAENPGESSADVDVAEVDASVAAQMRRLARSFLVHSFLYERLGEPLIELRGAHMLPDTLPRPVRSGCRACCVRPGEAQG